MEIEQPIVTELTIPVQFYVFTSTEDESEMTQLRSCDRQTDE